MSKRLTEVLNHQLDLPVLHEGDRRAVVLLARTGDRPADSGTERTESGVADGAVAAGSRVPEEGVALLSDHLVGRDSERLLRRPVHPGDGVLRIVDDYDIVYHVEDDVHQLLSVDLAELCLRRHVMPGEGNRLYGF